MTNPPATTAAREAEEGRLTYPSCPLCTEHFQWRGIGGQENILRFTSHRESKEARDTYRIEKNLPSSLLNLHGFLNNYLGKLKYEETKSSAFPGPSICAYSYSLNGIPPFPGGQRGPSRPRALNTYLLSNFS